MFDFPVWFCHVLSENNGTETRNLLLLEHEKSALKMALRSESYLGFWS